MTTTGYFRYCDISLASHPEVSEALRRKPSAPAEVIMAFNSLSSFWETKTTGMLLV